MGPASLDNGTGTVNVSKIAWLSLLSALNRLSMSFNQIVFPLFVLAIGSDEAFYGLIVAMAGYVQSLVVFPAGSFSDKRGRGPAILFGGLFSGTVILLLPFAVDTTIVLILYAATGIGSGFRMSSVQALIADATKRGDERTQSYGYTTAIATLVAVAGPFIGGFVLDETAFPGIDPVMVRYMILFFIMGGLRITAGFVGFIAERRLNDLGMLDNSEVKDTPIERTQDADNDTKTATLFGISRLIMGFSSGMVVPYMILWIIDAFNPSEVVLGSIPAIAGLTLASGALFVGLMSERTGKLKMITGLYILAPILTIGIVYSPRPEGFVLMAIFYISRQAVANMAQPANNSLLMGEISQERRGRSYALTRIMWTFPRQTGTLVASAMLSAGFFASMTEFGVLVFPIAMVLYPISVIPMYLAVKRNRELVVVESMDSPDIVSGTPPEEYP
ncbi:MAG: MFS transporter [Candidatus Thorarchaeota archaeon]